MTTSVSWMTDPCPAWCEVEHGEADYEQDRLHERSVLVPSIREARRAVEAVEVGVSITQRVGEQDAWVTVSDDLGSLTLSAESALRVARAVLVQVESLP